MKNNNLIQNDHTIDQQTINKQYEELNSMCSYLAMFPSAVPAHFIEHYTKKGDLVYEPFAGRGTTTLQAIKLGRRVVSTDLSPLAYVLTKSKTHKISLEEVNQRIDELEREFAEWKKDFKFNFRKKTFEDIKVFYSNHNLKQLYFLREKIGRNYNKLNKIDNFILAIALGIAHGKVRSTGDKNNSLYFSVSMPNGMSMAPRYAERFIAKNNLHKIETNIFEQIKIRATKKNPECISDEYENITKLHDATKGSELFSENEKPKLIFTSPPYLNLIKYVDQNWIRFWLLGFDRKDERTRKMVNDYHASEEYKTFLKTFMLDMHKIMDNETRLMMVIGDVKVHNIQDIMNEIFEDERIKLRFKKDKTKEFKKENPIPQLLKNKLSRQMGNRVGNATKHDWVFSFRRK